MIHAKKEAVTSARVGMLIVGKLIQHQRPYTCGTLITYVSAFPNGELEERGTNTSAMRETLVDEKRRPGRLRN